MKDDELFLRVNGETELIKSLEKTYQFIQEEGNDIYSWKWIIIGLHNAVQNCMVFALRGSSTISILRNDSKRNWLNWYNNEARYPETLMMNNFSNLFEGIKSNNMTLYKDSKSFISNNEIDESMKLLNTYRNNFIHFIPQNWVLILSCMPKICIDVLSVINFLINESTNINSYNKIHIDECRKIVDKIITKLEELRRKYSSIN